ARCGAGRRTAVTRALAWRWPPPPPPSRFVTARPPPRRAWRSARRTGASSPPDQGRTPGLDPDGRLAQPRPGGQCWAFDLLAGPVPEHSPGHWPARLTVRRAGNLIGGGWGARPGAAPTGSAC